MVPKSDKTMRICGDYKVTVNRCIEEETYPLPNSEDLFATLAGGTLFSKLDLSHAYQQLELDENSKALLTVNTHKGLYQYNRLSYGVSSAPSIFQAVMDQILQDMPGVVCYLDDILISAKNKVEHLELLDKVLTRLEKYGVRVKLAKCEFMSSEVVYLGHRIDATGIHPTDDKISAIKEAPIPQNVTELRSFLGLVNYYHKFLPNMSTRLKPLYSLLQKGIPFVWSKECNQAFINCKQDLLRSNVLVHYDCNKEIRLACDASPYGLGAVISHVIDGHEKPIAFSSRTLTPAEKGYAQIEKEALSIIFGVTKFHKYLYGRRFTLVTDHKPLLAILGPKSAIPTLAAMRMQRWALRLLAYSYDIEYRRSEDHLNADCMSRLPLDNVSKENQDVFYFSYVDDLPITAKDIAKFTLKDPELSKVLQYTLNGWPNYVPDETLKPYFTRRTELSVDQNCLLWGLRVIIPENLRSKLLEDLHMEHPGIVRMKSLARSYLWWPNLDKEIENKVKSCEPCMMTRNAPTSAPLHPWQWPQRPFQRIHIDFAEKDGLYFLVLIDSHSKWIEVSSMKSITSEKTIAVLRHVFTSFGIPEEIVSDNGPQFSSAEFSSFCCSNGIKHTLVPPYHPASNGAAERSVQILKKALLKHVFSEDSQNLSLQHRLDNFLLMYRTTPHSVTGHSPDELFLKRKLRTRFTLLHPDLSRTIESKQQQQKLYHDQGRKQLREFSKNDCVLVRNFRGGKEKWVRGKVLKKLGPLTYLVVVFQKVRYVHVDHMQSCENVSEGELTSDVPKDMSVTPSVMPKPTPVINEPHVAIQDNSKIVPVVPEPSLEPSPILSPKKISTSSPKPDKTISIPDKPVIESVPLRRSSRIITKPEKLNLYIFG